MNKIIDHWIESAKRDRQTAQTLFDNKFYDQCLFYCHLLLEKMLKVKVMKIINDHAPKIHDLVRLAKLAQIKLDNQQIVELNEINGFNLEARYDDYKFEFYKKATKDFTKTWLAKTDDYIIWLEK